MFSILVKIEEKTNYELYQVSLIYYFIIGTHCMQIWFVKVSLSVSKTDNDYFYFIDFISLLLLIKMTQNVY